MFKALFYEPIKSNYIPFENQHCFTDFMSLYGSFVCQYFLTKL